MGNTQTTRCGTIAIIGRPNVGKSTLLNKILGEKLSITSAKPQTTRHQIRGIKTTENTQWIYIDTPGLHQQTERRLSRGMVREAINALINVDVIGFVIEAGRWTSEDEAILKRLYSQQLEFRQGDVNESNPSAFEIDQDCRTSANKVENSNAKPIKQQVLPIILIVNKVDKIKDKTRLLPFLKSCSEKMSFLAVIPLSAKKGDNVAALEKIIAEQLPLAEFAYPVDQFTDRNQSFLAAEFIREKLMRALHQELPYWLTVIIEEFRDEKKIIKIRAVILSERTGQKAIIIGKNGELLKKVGTEARLDMEQCFGKKVYLNLWVKVKAGWSEQLDLPPS